MRFNQKLESIPDLENAANSSKRGRPRKNGKDSRGESYSYWLGEVFIDQGWAWSTELVETQPVDGGKRWQAHPICLGTEDDVVPILKGDKQIPDDLNPRRRAILESMVEVNQHGRAEGALRASRLQRRGYARAFRHRQKDARRLKAREGLAFHKAYR